MKSALFVPLLILAAASGVQAGTAYSALELIGKQRGEKIVDQVTEVRGINGSPQPKEWVICTIDKDARGGLREFGIQGTKIVSERTPTGHAVGSLMNMNQLNLDSDGAQTVAEREAKKAGFVYDYADYVLHAGTHGGAPVWELHLVNEKSGGEATLVLAADKGTVLSSEGLTGGHPAPPPPPEDLRHQANNGGRQRPLPPPDQQPPPEAHGNFFQRAGDTMGHFFDRVGTHLERRGRQIGDKVHNVFTGDNRDTAGPHHPGDEDPRDTPPAPPTNAQPQPQPRIYRDANGTEYLRPRD